MAELTKVIIIIIIIKIIYKVKKIQCVCMYVCEASCMYYVYMKHVDSSLHYILNQVHLHHGISHSHLGIPALQSHSPTLSLDYQWEHPHTPSRKHSSQCHSDHRLATTSTRQSRAIIRKYFLSLQSHPAVCCHRHRHRHRHHHRRHIVWCHARSRDRRYIIHAYAYLGYWRYLWYMLSSLLSFSSFLLLSLSTTRWRNPGATSWTNK